LQQAPADDKVASVDIRRQRQLARVQTVNRPFDRALGRAGVPFIAGLQRPFEFFIQEAKTHQPDTVFDR